jgi:hypothetical protein
VYNLSTLSASLEQNQQSAAAVRVSSDAAQNGREFSIRSSVGQGALPHETNFFYQVLALSEYRLFSLFILFGDYWR